MQTSKNLQTKREIRNYSELNENENTVIKTCEKSEKLCLEGINSFHFKMGNVEN